MMLGAAEDANYDVEQGYGDRTQSKSPNTDQRTWLAQTTNYQSKRYMAT